MGGGTVPQIEREEERKKEKRKRREKKRKEEKRRGPVVRETGSWSFFFTEWLQSVRYCFG